MGKKAASPSVVPDEADRQIPPREESVAPVEVKEAVSDPPALAGADYLIDLGDEFIAAVEEEKVVGPSTAPAGADRRTHPRYEFTAAVEVIAAESGARIETRVRDLSQQGCYVDTSNALPLGTETDIDR